MIKAKDILKKLYGIGNPNDMAPYQVGKGYTLRQLRIDLQVLADADQALQDWKDNAATECITRYIRGAGGIC